MNDSQILLEAKKLLSQYRDVPSLDKSREMLLKKYGEQPFFLIRKQFAVCWLEQHGMKKPNLENADNSAVKRKKRRKDPAYKESKRKQRYDRAAAARNARIISPSTGPKAVQPNADKIKDESIYTHMSLHTLRG